MKKGCDSKNVFRFGVLISTVIVTVMLYLHDIDNKIVSQVKWHDIIFLRMLFCSLPKPFNYVQGHNKTDDNLTIAMFFEGWWDLGPALNFCQ